MKNFPFNESGFDDMRAWIADNQAKFNSLYYDAQEMARIIGGDAWLFHCDFWEQFEEDDSNHDQLVEDANWDFSPEGFERYQTLLFVKAGVDEARVRSEMRQLETMEGEQQ
ncbi:hypothetical protein [Xanthomonas hortorum]|uniref:hypothetical protein n=1 Tax=Xanthomonas hortorum TaxID=56454 RepID=UPI0015D5E662|nr:hypothetical protein [Xanthomonas hortorum]MCE4344085.1 hypothetical protein [Xanthomonas hortorum pv. vitians]NMI19789.1 hypothetical protein [Xanthomonas hortorum pv. vitians]